MPVLALISIMIILGLVAIRASSSRSLADKSSCGAISGAEISVCGAISGAISLFSGAFARFSGAVSLFSGAIGTGVFLRQTIALNMAPLRSCSKAGSTKNENRWPLKYRLRLLLIWLYEDMDELNGPSAQIWMVYLTRKAAKQVVKLPREIFDTLAILRAELEVEGPVQPEWRNYGKLKGKKGEYYHCHLNSGQPRYVAVWEVEDKAVKLIAIVFAGTHESVNYGLFK